MQLIEVQWEGDYPTHYPYLWLRDNCQCDKCFHPFTKARKLLMKDLNLDSVPRGSQGMTLNAKYIP